MNAHDAERAKWILAEQQVMFASMAERDGHTASPGVVDKMRVRARSFTIGDRLTGTVRACGTSLNRLAIAKQSDVSSAAHDIEVTLRRMKLADTMGMGSNLGAYDDARAGAEALAAMKEGGGSLDLGLFDDNAARFGTAFAVLLHALIVDIAVAHNMSPAAVCDRLSAEIESITEGSSRPVSS